MAVDGWRRHAPWAWCRRGGRRRVGVIRDKGRGGQFHADLKRRHRERCDANHVKFHLKFEGEQTSSDDRLAGDFEAKVETVQDTNTGYGYTSGTVVIREEGRRNRIKFRGKVVGVVEPDGGAEGFIIGRTTGRKSLRLLANFNANQNPYTLAISGEFGKDSQKQDPYGPHEDQDPAVLTDACDKRSRPPLSREQPAPRGPSGGRAGEHRHVAVLRHRDAVLEALGVQARAQVRAGLEAVVDRVEVDGDDRRARGAARERDDVVGGHHDRVAAREAGAARVDDDDVGPLHVERRAHLVEQTVSPAM